MNQTKITDTAGTDLAVPYLQKPAAKDYLWGGSRIRERFVKDTDLVPLAETWECSAHPDGPSRFADGPFAGQTLPEVLRAHPEFLGGGRGPEEFPVLVKWIDARQSLSVQVHPDGEFARRVEGEPRGKNEVWYIAEAEPGAQIVYGFERECRPDEVRAAAADGTLTSLLHREPVQAGDLIPIPAGTVHAIGAGILLAEIQENSNLTYRLYDWGRLGADGKPRALHLDKACAAMHPGPAPALQAAADRASGACLYAGDLFRVYRYAGTDATPDFGSSFGAVLCIRGEGSCGGTAFRAGDCLFLPAGCRDCRVRGDFEILTVRENLK